MMIRGLAYLLIATMFLNMPAFADETRKAPAQQDIMKQETVALGGNRFLIFSGTAGDKGQYGYTVDLVKIDAGIPHFDPLFIEEYHPDTNTAKLEYGIAFLAISYHFDKTSSTLTYTVLDDDNNAHLQLTYKLDVDIFKLVQVVSQEACDAPCTPPAPKTIYPTHVAAK